MKSVLTIAMATAATVALSTAAVADPRPNYDVFVKYYVEDVNVKLDNDIKVDLKKKIHVSKDLYLVGIIGIFGEIIVNNSAMATIDDKQVVDRNHTYAMEYNHASFHDSYNGHGNLQVNVAAGVNNAQDNSAALAATAIHYGGYGSVDAEIFGLQESYGNDTHGYGKNYAEIFHLFEGAGNLQGNVAAGVGNMQKNNLALAVSAGDVVLAEASAAVLQQVSNNYTKEGGVNHADVKYIAQKGSGNVQLNAAAGVNNAQANNLSVAATVH